MLSEKVKIPVPEEILLKAFLLMCTAKAMTELYEANASVTSKYVHATSRGHEAIQLAVGLQLKPQDYVSLSRTLRQQPRLDFQRRTSPEHRSCHNRRHSLNVSATSAYLRLNDWSVMSRLVL